MSEARDAPSVALSVPIVGVGASAGGLEAFTQMLGSLPADTGMAFVLVQHLSPGRPSRLSEILSRATSMPVTEVSDKEAVEPNRVYVIPPDKDVVLAGGAFELVSRETPRGQQHHPIDRFFQSLAAGRGHRAIGVVLSGTATDGTLGLREIKAAGGITFAQDDSAQYHGMPTSAVASGCVDLVLAPAPIADELTRIARHPYVVPPPASKPGSTADDRSIAAILGTLYRQTGVDFTRYKVNTLRRRISRRMLLLRLDGLGGYAQHLAGDPAEVEALYQDILINVTSFFRDPEQLEALQSKFLPRLLERRSSAEPLRAWVLGCSTGEEAYSLAMTISESMETAGSRGAFQIFATDLNAAGIEKARAGVYPKSIERDVSPQRLRRFFTEADGSYRIIKSIRDLCVFARHNVLTDPPFSRVDIVSCRNLLIYFEPDMQQRVLPVLHFALNPAGLLLLGSSETAAGYRDFFEVEDSANRIYSKKAGSPGIAPHRPRAAPPSRREAPDDGPADRRAHTGPEDEIQRILLDRFAPAAVVIDSRMEILHFRGDTSPYLTTAPGKASLAVLSMARSGLRAPLLASIQRAKRERAPVRSDWIHVADKDGHRDLGLEVIPVPGTSPPSELYLVVFDPAPRGGRPPEGTGAGSTNAMERLRDWLRRGPARGPLPQERGESADEKIGRLSQELTATREYLQSIIETQEAANEELQSANEEAQSANEELQSINEELETSKEEIQATSEELATLNDELQHRNTEIGQINNDLLNLITSVEIPIVMLGSDMSIRRFSPGAGQMLHIRHVDLGRSIHEVKLPIDAPDLERTLEDVIATGSVREISVRDPAGRWCALRVRPYRTLDNKIDGAVLMLVDVDTLQRAKDYAESIVQAVREPLLVLDGNLIVQRASRAYYEMFQTTPAQTERRSFLDVGAGQWRVPALQALIQEVRSGSRTLDDFEVVGDFPGIGRRVMLVTARRLPDEGDGHSVLIAIDDATARRSAEAALMTRVADLRAADQSKDEFLAMLAHELRGPLSPLRSAAHILNDPEADTQTLRHARATIERQSRTMARLIDDLLDVARITQRKIDLRREPVELATLLERAVDLNRDLSESRAQSILVSMPPGPVILDADAGRLEQVFGNLLNNACKFSERGARIWLDAKLATATGPSPPEVEVHVRDEGIGIAPDMLTRVFDLFQQADRSLHRVEGGLGIGLTIVRRLVEMHGGTVTASSEGKDKGSEFVVRLPVARPGEVAVPGDPAEATPGISAVPGPRRVLVVDDNADGADSLAALLRLGGHEVHVAYSGPEALGAAGRIHPDVVLLDIGLPGMTGYEVAQRIRAQETEGRTLLIAVTGYGQPDDIDRSLGSGFDHHLTKPIDIAALRRLVPPVAAATKRLPAVTG
ncbi:MAG: chemotaxis protein CheB [Bacteroidota bacterium]